MEEGALLDIAGTWSFWDRAPAQSVPRNISLPATLTNRTILVIQGVRKCGKSTLLTQLITKYRLKRENCLFVNFEDPRLAGALNFETLERFSRLFEKMRPDAEHLTMFLDEIQWVQGWERWLRTKLERPSRLQFVVSGSNAHLLSGELSTSLTGRHVTVELFPFDFGEFRQLRSGASLEEYLHSGGFPEPSVSPDEDLLLRQYFVDILQRDVRERVGARSSLTLRHIAQMVFESTGSELSLRRISAATGIAVDTVSNYLEACEQAYLLFSCPWFTFSDRRRVQRNRKYYPVDTGLRRVAVTRTGKDIGKALECVTFIELRKRFETVSYWRDQGEVDFVIQVGQRPLPIQVTLEAPMERHLRALDAFYEAFPHSQEAVFVTPDNFPQVLGEIGET